MPAQTMIPPTNPGRPLDQFNDRLRATPVWQEFMRRHGYDVSRSWAEQPIHLSDSQRKQLKYELQRSGYAFPGDLEIDPSGNINQNEGFGKQVKRWGPVVAAGVITAFGIPGVFPGLVGGSGAGGAAAASGGVLPSSSIPSAMGSIGGPAAISSMGASSAIGAAMPAAWGFETAAMPAGIGALKGVGLTPRMIAENAAAGGRGLPSSITDYLGNKPSQWGDAARNTVNGARQLNPLLQSAIAGLAGLPALLANNGPSNEEKALLDEARQMQALQRQRIQSQNPLFEAVTRLAMSRLPGSVQQG